MKLNNFLATIVAVVSVVSCNRNELKTKKSLDTNIDSVSYALGLEMAERMKADSASKVNPDLFIQGYAERMDSQYNTLIDKKEVKKVIAEYFQKIRVEQMKKREEKMKKKAEETHKDYKKENEQFLINNKSKDGIITTESGLQYKVIKEGKGKSPELTDKVKVHYHGILIDGIVFDSTIENKKKPAEFRVTQVIKGWTEGLQLMKPGAKYKFFIPQELGYGYQQKGSVLKPFSTLIFDIELLEVIPILSSQLEEGHSKGDGHGH